MRVIVPHDIDLAYTSVADNSEAEWSASTTYAMGDLAKVSTSFPHRVYRSLRGNNTNRPPANWLVPQVEVSTSTTSIEPAEGEKTFTIGTYLGFAAGMQVRIAKTLTPASVNMVGEISSYTPSTGVLVVLVSSVQGTGSHSGWTVTSEDEIGYWEEVEVTNRHKMFDGYMNTQTVASEEIHVKLNVTRADYVALFGLAGVKVEFWLWDSGETEVLWSDSINLAYGAAIVSAISDWYEYFFGEYSFQDDAAAQIGVITYSGVLEIKITAATGEGAACGGIVVGRRFDVGITKLGGSAGMIDFTTRVTDALGRTTIAEGYWAKRNTIQVVIPLYKIDMVYKLLTSLRGKPTAWLGNNDGTEFESMTVFGICKDWSIVFSGKTRAGLDIEIEGMI